MISRPATPGTNSWTVEACEPQHDKGMGSQPTNRSKYEDKPMPPLPLDIFPSHRRVHLATSNHSSVAGGDQVNQAKASTDPLASRITLLHEAEGSNSDSGGYKADYKPVDQAYKWNLFQAIDSAEQGSPTDNDSKESLQDLFQSPISSPHSIQKAISEPSSTASVFTGTRSACDDGHEQYKGKTDASLTYKQQAYLKPVPLHQHMPGLPNSGTLLDLSSAAAILRSARQFYPGDESDPQEAHGIVLGNGYLHPTSSNSYGTMGEGQYIGSVQQQRVSSSVGMIESYEPTEEAISHRVDCKEEVSSGAFRTTRPTSVDHGRIWENNPDLGHSLPPFSPAPLRQPYGTDPLPRNPVQVSKDTVPSAHGDPKNRPSRLRNGISTGPLANSWASSPSRNHSKAPTTELPMSATVPPLFAQRESGNSAPTPPHSMYQPHFGLPSAELSRLELNIHHHLDSVLSSLTRSIIDKEDETTDQLIRRMERIEKRLENTGKLMKETKESFESLKTATAAALKDIEVNFRNRTEPLGALGPISSSHDLERSESDQSVKAFKPRPRRSHSVLISPTHQTHGQGHGASSLDAMQYENEQLDTQHTYTTRGASHGEGRVNTEQFARVGVSLNSPPDIRLHPALRDSSEKQKQGVTMSHSKNSDIFYSSRVFPSQSLSGWYSRAFGE